MSRYKEALETIAERACPHSTVEKDKTCFDVWGMVPHRGWCYPCLARWALEDEKGDNGVQ